MPPLATLGGWIISISVLNHLENFFFFLFALTLGRTRKAIPPPLYKGVGGREVMKPLPWFFDMLQYVGKVLPSVENLSSYWQDEVYSMDAGAAGGLWRHHRWLPSWILPRIINHVTERTGSFLCLTCKLTHKQVGRLILSTGFAFIVETSWKTCIFTQKWLNVTCYLWSHIS